MCCLNMIQYKVPLFNIICYYLLLSPARPRPPARRGRTAAPLSAASPRPEYDNITVDV